jgi:hypothetical protein
MSEPYYDIAAVEEAKAAVNDPEYIARALCAGIGEGSAAALAQAFQFLKTGRHDEADMMARSAESLLMHEYMEGVR